MGKKTKLPMWQGPEGFVSALMHRSKVKPLFIVVVFTEEEDGTLGSADHQTDNSGNDNSNTFANFSNPLFLVALVAIALVAVGAIG